MGGGIHQGNRQLHLVVFGFLALVAPGLWRRAGKIARWKSQQDFGDFDMKVEAAADYIVDSTHHSFTRSSLAERNAFKQLHKAMCSGRLAVIGKKGEEAIPQKISARRCRKLHRIEVVTPQGMRFHLTERNLQERPPVPFEKSDPLGFQELRIRSQDLYGIWPRDSHGVEA